MATPVQVFDPFDTATDAKIPDAEYFGEVVLDAWHCVLEKGVGKRPFDPAADDPSKRRTAVDIVILPLPEQNITFPLERKLIAENNGWVKITWPSLQKCGITNAREAKNKFCHVKLSPTGRTWKGEDGETKNETTFEFIALYPDEAACRAAYSGVRGATPTEPAPAPVAEDPQAAAKKTALTFAKAIITNLARADKDPESVWMKVAEKLKGMPMVTAHYAPDSPEIMALIAESIA